MDALRILILIGFLITLTSTSDLEGLVQSEKELMFEDESEKLSDRMDRDLEAVAADGSRGFLSALAGFPDAIDELINGKRSRAVSKPKNGSRIIPIVGRIIKNLAARSDARAAKKMDEEREPKVKVTVIQEGPMMPEMSRVQQEGDDRSSNVGLEESTGNAKREAQQGGPKTKGMPIPAGYILWHPVSANFEGIEGASSEQQPNFSPNQRMHNADHPHRPFFIPLRQPSFQNQPMPQFGTPSLFALPPISAAADAGKKPAEMNDKNKKVPKQKSKNERNKPQFNLPNQHNKPQFNLPNMAPNHFPNSPFFDPQLNQVNRPFPPPNFPQPNHPPPPQFGPPQNQNRPFPPPQNQNRPFPPPQQFNFNNPLPQNGPHFSESQQFFHHRPNPMQQQEDLFHHINRFGPPHPDQFPQPSINVPFQFQRPPFRPRPNPGPHPAKFQIEHEKKMRDEFGPFMPPPPPPPFNPNMLPPHLPPPPLPHQFPPFIPMDHPPMNEFGPPNKPFDAKENNKFANSNQRPNDELAKLVRNSNGPKNSNLENGRPNVGPQGNSNFRQKKPDFESEKPNFEAKKPNFGNSNFEAGKPNFELKKPNSGIENPNFENERPHFEHGKPHFEPRRPSFDQGKPNFELERPHFNPERQHFNGERPHFNEEGTNFNKGKPNFSKERPNFNEERPHFNEEGPNFNKGKPNFNKERPNFNEERPHFNQERPNANQERPNINQERPNFNQERPNFNQERPNFNQRPNFETKKPNSGPINPSLNQGRTNFNSPSPNFDSARPNFGPNNLHLESGRQNFGPGSPNSRPVHANFEGESSNFKSATSRFSSTTPRPMMFEASSTMMTPVIARDFHKLPPTPHTPSSKNTPKHHKETSDNSFEYPPFGLPPSPTRAPAIVDVSPLNIYTHLEAGTKKPDMIFEHFQVQEPKVRSGNAKAKVKNHSEESASTHPPPLVHHLPPPHYAADTYLEHQLSSALSEVTDYVATTPNTMTSSRKTPKNWSKNSPEHVRSSSTPATVYQYEVKYSSPFTFKPPQI